MWLQRNHKAVFWTMPSCSARVDSLVGWWRRALRPWFLRAQPGPYWQWLQENPKPWLFHQSSIFRDTSLSALVYSVLAILIRKRVKRGTVGCFLILHCLINRGMLQPIKVTHLQVKIYNTGHKNNGTRETKSLKVDSMKMIRTVILFPTFFSNQTAPVLSFLSFRVDW